MRRALPALAVVLVAGLAHVGALNGPFLWDDHWLVFEHPVVTGARPLGAAFSTLFWEGRSFGTSTYYRPLVILSLAIDRRLFGDAPAGYHAVNLLLHAATSALVYLVVRRAGVARRPAMLAAMLFATLPRLTESVAWISGRTDLLAALFLLGALLAHQAGRRFAAALGVLLALLCKELAVIAPALLVLWDLTRAERAPWNVLARRLWPVVAAVALFFPLRSWATGSLFPSAQSAPLWTRLVLVARTAGHYAWMIATPTDPAARIGARSDALDGWALAGVLVLAALAAWAVWIWRRRGGAREALFGPAWTALALAPVLNFAPAPTFNLAADRFLYLPAVGLAVLVGRRLMAWHARTPRTALAAGAAALAVFSFSTARRSAVYTDELLYWRDAAVRAPAADAAVWENLGQIELRTGRAEDALASFQEAARRARGLPTTRNFVCELSADMALAHSALGQDDEALRGLVPSARSCADVAAYPPALALVQARQLDLDLAARTLEKLPREQWTGTIAPLTSQRIEAAKEILRAGDPSSTAAARALAALGADRKAEARFRQAIQAGEPGADLELARWLIERERFDDAARALGGAIERRPDDAVAHYWLGYALLQSDRGELARGHLRRALELDPHLPNRAAVEKILAGD